MISHALVIAGGGPTGLMLAGELALAGVDAVVVERRPDQALAGARALGGLGLRQQQIERLLAGWVTELGAPILYGRDITGFVQHDAGAVVALADGGSIARITLSAATVDPASSARLRGSTSRAGSRRRAASSRRWR